MKLGIFWADFRKIDEYQITRKSYQWELSCSTRTGKQTDGQTDMTELTINFRNFLKAPKDAVVHCITLV